MTISLDQAIGKSASPPAPQNWVRLISPGDQVGTANKIAALALGMPSFNYVSGATMCRDRVQFGIERETALKAIARSGAPAGRLENARFVEAFYDYDETRGYSGARYIDDSYHGFFPISRTVKIPTKPTFSILENRQQIPVVLCGWKSVPLDIAQRRIIVTVYESGLFSYGQYRNSPWEIVFFPELNNGTTVAREPEVWRRGDYLPIPAGELRDLLEFYALAQELAVPIIREKWAKRQEQQKRRSGVDDPSPEYAEGSDAMQLSPRKDLFSED